MDRSDAQQQTAAATKSRSNRSRSIGRSDQSSGSSKLVERFFSVIDGSGPLGITGPDDFLTNLMTSCPTRRFRAFRFDACNIVADSPVYANG